MNLIVLMKTLFALTAVLQAVSTRTTKVMHLASCSRTTGMRTGGGLTLPVVMATSGLNWSNPWPVTIHTWSIFQSRNEPEGEVLKPSVLVAHGVV